MNASKFVLSLLGVGTLMLSSALLAQQATPAPQPVPGAAPGTQSKDVPSFAELDKAHKGRLKRSDIPKDVEGLKQLRAHFKEADTDGNGWITPDEYSAYASGANSPHTTDSQ